MYRLLELFVLLILIVTIIHYTATLSLISLVSVISQNSTWINSLVHLIKILFVSFDFTINDSSDLYHAVDIESSTKFVLISSLVMVSLCLIFCYTKVFFFIFRVSSIKKYTIIGTGKFINELGFVITWLSLCALYNQIFYMFDYIIFSKSLMYNSLHALILFILFKTKAYGIDIKKRPKPLKT